jgi:competence protein ComEA
MKTYTMFFFVAAFSVLVGLMASGVILLIANQPQGKALVLEAAPSPAPLRVHVSGAVVRPGVYSLTDGSRVEDAVQAAGGFSAQAATDSINLAAQLKDGVQIVVPGQGVDIGKTKKGEMSRLNLNAATQEDLEKLPGIGQVAAQKILQYREENGLFLSIEDIQQVPGIGPATFEKIKDLIIVQ